jgi:hypothetical protein
MRGIPVRVEYDDGVGPGDVEPNSAHLGGQQEQEYPIITVELSNQALPDELKVKYNYIIKCLHTRNMVHKINFSSRKKTLFNFLTEINVIIIQ